MAHSIRSTAVRRGQHPVPAIERYWPKVDVLGEDECWPWLAATTKSGHGQFKVNGQMDEAHRFGWEVAYGPIPEGLHVLHECDTAGCQNPKHWKLGTNTDNVRDRVERGREADRKGDKNPRARLSSLDVLSIRSELAEGRTLSFLSRKYGVCEASISHINTRRTWRHLN